MAVIGILPNSIAMTPILEGVGCMLSAITKKTWRTKGDAGNQVVRKTNITRLVHYVSGNKLESPQFGLITQLKGITTKKRYQYANFLWITIQT